MKYGTRLRELIEKHGLKQAEVAEKIKDLTAYENPPKSKEIG